MNKHEGVKAFDTESAARSYRSISSLSIGYITSIRAIVEKGFQSFIKNKKQLITVLEVGAGQGKSSWATKQTLKSIGIRNVKIIGTEKAMKQIKEGHATKNYWFINNRKDRKLIPPKIQSDAEYLPILSESADVHMSSQVDHWIVPKESLLESYKEAFRILKSDGLLVHAVSGLVDLGENNKYHFTRSPFYQEGFLIELKNILISKGYWNKNLGEFDPYNLNVNPFYHQYSLEPQQENGIPNLLKRAGFNDIKVDYYMACLDAKEMEARMTNLAMLNMHLFQGNFAANISEEERQSIAKKAFEVAKKNKPNLWSQLSLQPNKIIEGMPQDLLYGEPVPVITARKK